MALSPRFALDTAAVVGGGFLVVSAMTFSDTTTGWLGFGVSTAFALAAAVAANLTRRTPQKLAHASLALVALWSLIAALVFDGSAQMWLVFASALALVGAALGDLIAHETTTERVVHQLDVRASRPARVDDSEDIAA